MRERTECARQIKKLLMKKYPNVKFSVRSYIEGWNSVVVVDYEDKKLGRDEVYNSISQYRAGWFNGQTDSYEWNNKETDLPQVMYISVYNNER